MRRTVIALSAAALAVFAGVALPSTASADDSCPSGHFCVTTDAYYNGYKRAWSGDDSWWESDVFAKDSSWINAGITGPGIPSYVRVYPQYFQGGNHTICLAPNQKVAYSSSANDWGASHEWDFGC
ncbi:peptidase inhibitor family I36 protein [Streptomyces sp. DH24]|uniref:peptidase inhibitor family I36 protein n=1 Tax=Streptomyces sp. DH24 TaxID=3040123 RepID=UPI002441DF7C|nr:peptidase inhibitor family I36 protein [Streptomyces sp. DH24]MDG9720671.1 peptidase inhibitor family I36 protein [Streptomyces sp. DH24]